MTSYNGPVEAVNDATHSVLSESEHGEHCEFTWNVEHYGKFSSLFTMPLLLTSHPTDPGDFNNSQLDENSPQPHASEIYLTPWDQMRSNNSDSGSDCPSPTSRPSTPASSPHLSHYEISSSASDLHLALEDLGNWNHAGVLTAPHSPVASIYNLSAASKSCPDMWQTASSQVLSESSTGSLLPPPNPAFEFTTPPESRNLALYADAYSSSSYDWTHPNSPAFSGHSSDYSPVHASPSPSYGHSPGFSGNSSEYSPSPHSSTSLYSHSLALRNAVHSPVPQIRVLTPFIHTTSDDLSQTYSTGTPALTSSHSLTSEEWSPLGRLPRSRTSSGYFSHAPRAQPTAVVPSEILSEVFDCMDGNEGPFKDASDIQRKVMSNLGISREDQKGKRLFGKAAKNTVSTPAGLAASRNRRRHEAKWVCQICGNNFTRNAGLKNHLKAHVGVTDQECQYCHNVFNTSLSRHEERCNSNPTKAKTQRKKNPSKARVTTVPIVFSNTLQTSPLFMKTPF
ncbi:hypothetical protein GALMADRAFT_138005 [Galerina marginata CBS 339.88]|uniref:C2H2-type domain-containing protein n=1 Tax=Galerina marginata (strain CBS 339.88) TaxID=685588 RepID=A0A067T7E7_GALM3|nr:hypothetical protein GALMADRAFT_138005 [Galerina marginata CBS 339.88]